MSTSGVEMSTPLARGAAPFVRAALSARPPTLPPLSSCAAHDSAVGAASCERARARPAAPRPDAVLRTRVRSSSTARPDRAHGRRSAARHVLGPQSHQACRCPMLAKQPLACKRFLRSEVSPSSTTPSPALCAAHARCTCQPDAQSMRSEVAQRRKGARPWRCCRWRRRSLRARRARTGGSGVARRHCQPRIGACRSAGGGCGEQPNSATCILAAGD